MESNSYQSIVTELLSLAGIEINGSNPWDIQVLDERFYRMWSYFLLSSAGGFRARNTNQLWQIVLSKKGVPGGYITFR
jgi:hypothetical protein